MKLKHLNLIILILSIIFFVGCENNGKADRDDSFIHLITLDPGHFHSALIQKTMYASIDSTVYVYAPEKGLGLREQLSYIEQYNMREDDPTKWKEVVYTGADFLNKMLSTHMGNVVVLAGNNKRKTEYIKKSIENGFNVLADKPMAINSDDFKSLENSFENAQKRNLIIYDIMTERSVAASILQQFLRQDKKLFGSLEKGDSSTPAIIMESTHQFFKTVSGKPLIRPAWFFDPAQEGGAIVDVGTHLVDLVQWICFPKIEIDYVNDIGIRSSSIWPTPISLSQFSKITLTDTFPNFLNQYVKDDTLLLTHGNGTFQFSIKGVEAKITTKWNYGGIKGEKIDTYYSLIRGTRSDLEVIQNSDEVGGFPELYVWPKVGGDSLEVFTDYMKNTFSKMNEEFDGIHFTEAVRKGHKRKGWRVVVPQKYMVGHEAHFAAVMQRFIKYFEEGRLPTWEVKNMISKYYVTTTALDMATQKH